MQYASPVPDGWNAPLASHCAYHFDSIWAGSKLFSIAMRSVTRKLRAVSWGKRVIVGGGKQAAKKPLRDLSCA
jgi:hypothetical protein